MAQQPIGNESNMEQVRKTIEQHKVESLATQINQGGNAESIIDIDYTSDEGIHYTGKVQFKRPTVMETMKMGGRKSEILREAGVQELTLVDPSIRLMAQALATLEIVIVKCPEWLLDIHKITDVDIIFHVYGRYEVWENSFRIKRIAEQAQNNPTADAEKAVAPSEALRG